MRTILQYKFNDSALFVIKINLGAKILSVGLDPTTKYPIIWALVDTRNALRERAFLIRSTGDTVDPEMEYICTVQNGEYVWHIFEVCP